MRLQKKAKEQLDTFTKSEFLYNSYKEYLEFFNGIEDSANTLVLLLSSKSVGDTVEAIRSFKLLKSFGFVCAEKGLRKMLTLVFSKEESVAREASETYETLYFSQSLSAEKKAKNLLSLMYNATLTDLTCLEELLRRILEQKKLEQDVLRVIMATYSQKSFPQLED